MEQEEAAEMAFESRKRLDEIFDDFSSFMSKLHGEVFMSQLGVGMVEVVG